MKRRQRAKRTMEQTESDKLKDKGRKRQKRQTESPEMKKAHMESHRIGMAKTFSIHARENHVAEGV